MNMIILDLINHFGTQSKLAHAMGVHQVAVSNWLHNKNHMSPYSALKIEKLSKGKFKAHTLCPKLEQLKNARIKTTPAQITLIGDR